MRKDKVHWSQKKAIVRSVNSKSFMNHTRSELLFMLVLLLLLLLLMIMMMRMMILVMMRMMMMMILVMMMMMMSMKQRKLVFNVAIQTINSAVIELFGSVCYCSAQSNDNTKPSWKR